MPSRSKKSKSKDDEIIHLAETIRHLTFEQLANLGETLADMLNDMENHYNPKDGISMAELLNNWAQSREG